MSTYEAFNWGKGVIERPQTEAHTGWMTAGVGADAVTLLQGLATDGAKALQNTRVAKAAATPVIRAGLLAMMAMSNSTGIGGPEAGGRFARGAAAFDGVSDAMEATKPPDSWQGSGSEAYGDRNAEQKKRAAAIADVDRTVKAVLDTEAEQIAYTRTILDRCQTALTLCIPPAIAAKAFPGGAAASLAIEIAGVAATMPMATDRFRDLAHNAARNATEIRRAGAAYDAIAAEAQQS